MLDVASLMAMDSNSNKAPRVGHKKSRKGCAQCKRRHVKCNEDSPCSNCIRHGVACSLAGGPNVPRDDARPRGHGSPTTSAPSLSREPSLFEASGASSITPSTSASISPGATSYASMELPEYSGIRVLTDAIDREGVPFSYAAMLDLELIHHFSTCYLDVLSENFGLDVMWQVRLPQVGFKFPYVMHGILGFSALHLATVEPDRAISLRASAINHLDQALVLYRQDNTPATAENAEARFVFSWLVAIFAYAIPPAVPPIDALVELFSLVKGIEVVLRDTMHWIAQGPFAPMLVQGFVERAGVLDDGTPMSMAYSIAAGTGIGNGEPVSHKLPEGFDFGLNHLDFLIGTHNMIPDDRRTCVLMIAELKTIYAQMLHIQGQCNIATIISFPQQDSTAFATLLKRRHPQALIILAYYTVLLDLVDSRWWLHGWGRRVLRNIVSSLGEEWKTWIDWPVQTVLMKPDRSAAGLGEDVMMDTMHVI